MSAAEGRPAKRARVASGAGAQSATTPAMVVAPRRCCIIVPFRDLHAAQKRAAHLRRFVPHMREYLAALCGERAARDGVSPDARLNDFSIIIVEQSDDKRKFNRGKLLNAGFELAKREICAAARAAGGGPRACAAALDGASFVFHDVDLLPQPLIRALYGRLPAPGAPMHIARCWNRYNNNPKYFGGVNAFRWRDFEKINGFPNNYWGWGGEDDELINRVNAVGLRPARPPRAVIDAGNGADPPIVDLEDMDVKQKIAFLKAEGRDWKCMVKNELLEEHARTWKTNGLNCFAKDAVEAAMEGDPARGVAPLPPPFAVRRAEALDRLGGAGHGGHATKYTVELGINGDRWDTVTRL